MLMGGGLIHHFWPIADGYGRPLKAEHPATRTAVSPSKQGMFSSVSMRLSRMYC